MNKNHACFYKIVVQNLNVGRSVRLFVSDSMIVNYFHGILITEQEVKIISRI